MKKWIAWLLCLGLLAGLSGCSLFEKEEPLTQNFPMEKMQTDFDTIGVITESATPYYSDRNDLVNTLLGHLQEGERVRIYYREISGGENWVFTDKGWIYGLYVQTQQGGIGIGGIGSVDVQDEPYNCHTAVEVFAREKPDYNSTVTATYPMGQALYIDALIPSDSGMWGVTIDGWVPMCDITMDDVGVRGEVGMEVVTDVTQRSGPGVEYDAMGVASPGLVLITNLAESHGILWGEVDGVVWICLDFVRMPGIMKLFTTEYMLFEPNRDRDPSAYYGQGNQGNQGNQGDQGNQGNQGNQGSQGNQGTMTQVPNNTPLVGSWSCFDENEFLRYGGVSGEGWVFNADGTFSFGGCEYAYFEDLGGWNGASGGWGGDGIFTYDGTELKLQINTIYDPDPSVSTDGSVEYRTHNCTVNGNYATWDGNYYRSSDVNDAVRDCVRRKAAEKVEDALVGTWNGDDGSRLELRGDGSFTDKKGSGKYVHAGQNLVLVYDSDYIGLYNISVSGDQMSASYTHEWSYVTVNFTRE